MKDSKGTLGTTTSFGGIFSFSQTVDIFDKHSDYYDELFVYEKWVIEITQIGHTRIRPHGNCLFNKQLGKIKLLEDCDTIGRLYFYFPLTRCYHDI